MISLFRKIRQKLLQENKVTRYLIYALGEIILVVIGILIALQINTANENKKDRILEAKYLRGLSSNLADDIAELEDQILNDSLQLDGYTTLVKAFTSEVIKSDPNALLRKIFLIQLVNSFEGNSIVFEDLKSSGRTNLIKDDSLRSQLLGYYQQREIMTKAEKDLINPVILEEKNKLFITDYVGINSAENLFFPEHWASQLPESSISDLFAFLKEDTSSKRVKDYANRAGYIKALILAKRRERIKLVQEAMQLREEIAGFLMESTDKTQ